MRKKLISLLTASAISCSLFGTEFMSTALANGQEGISVMVNGEVCEEIALAPNEKKTVSASEEAESIQWQIKTPDGDWVNILGANEQFLTVSESVIGSALDADGNTAIRSISNHAIISDEVKVYLTNEEAEKPIEEPAEEFEAPVVLQEAYEIPPEATYSMEPQDQLYFDEVSVETAELSPDGTVVSDETAGEEFTDGYLEEPLAYETPEEPGEVIIHSLVINYVFADGRAAAAPWTASIAHGESFNTTVVSPQVAGYEPDEDKKSYTWNLASVEKDETVTITYHPALVNFKIRQHFQNIDNDEYSEGEQINTQALTESEVKTAIETQHPELLTKEGFRLLYYPETEKIAADGSTEINLYYDRNYYLMSFDMGGGYGSEPVYAKYGAPVTVADPTMKGYKFLYWSETPDGDQAEVPSVMPAENRKYFAVWKAEETATVKYVLWGENADDENYSYLKTVEDKDTVGSEITWNGSLDPTFKVCNQESHSHDLSCYDSRLIGESVSWPTSAPWYPSNGQIYVRRSTKYIYLYGSWYSYSGSKTNGQIEAPVCGKQENSHVHDEDCKWKFIKSETKTVEADGSTVINVYFDRNEFTFYFHVNRSNTFVASTDKTITAKWGAYILDIFKDSIQEPMGQDWYVARSGNSITSFIHTMESKNRHFYQRESGNTVLGKANYYFEKINASDSGKWSADNYDLIHEINAYNSGFDVDAADRPEINGFMINTDHSSKNGDDYIGSKFYYDRRTYQVSFDNIRSKTTKPLKYQYVYSRFGDSKSTDYVEPIAPDSYEPGSVKFAGWYLNPECTGEAVDLNTFTQPATDICLYAKWIPVTHTITFSLTKDETPFETQHISHRHFVQTDNPMITDPEYKGYEFAGWFYTDVDGTEKRYSFEAPVIRDLNLYAKWNSNVPVTYTVRYVFKDDEGKETEIAKEESYTGLNLTTKTFEAKTGTALYPDYQTGYYPETSSTSVTLDAEDGNKVVTFYYIQKEKVGYTIRYLNKEDGSEIHPEVNCEPTSDAIVTVPYKHAAGFMPDAFQKRLILSGNEKDNVITFWYTQNDKNAPVKISHLYQNIAGNDYEERFTTEDLNAVIGDQYTASIRNVKGFTFEKAEAFDSEGKKVELTPNSENSEFTAVLPKEGLNIVLKYTRNKYDFKFKFLEQGTDKVLADPVTGTAPFEDRVTQMAISIPGYSTNTDSQNLVISTESETNTRTFYYVENEVKITYQAVDKDRNPLTLTDKDGNPVNLLSLTEEKVKVFSGNPAGSTATAPKGYKFTGWFDKTGKKVSDNPKFVPDKKDKAYGDKDGYVSGDYYAVFERDLQKLTVNKTVNSAADSEQSFIFKVKDVDGKEQQIVVKVAKNTLTGSASLLLPAGAYTVTEDESWSWTYKADAKEHTVNLESGKDGSVTFNNTRSNKWFHDEKSNTNHFTGKGGTR